MKRILILLLSLIFMFCTFFTGCNNVDPIEPPINDDETVSTENIVINYFNGEISVESEASIYEYKYIVNDSLLLASTEPNVNIARIIIDKKLIAYGKWKVDVEGYNSSGDKIAQTKDSFSFEIKELNQENFVNTLKREYKDTDYFLLSEDIYIYGKGNTNVGTKSDYANIIFLAEDRADNNNALFFVANPFTATIDGNGFSLNVIVDQHINWSGSQLPFVYGGVFNEICDNAKICNLQVYTDSVYEVKSRSGASASFVFKLSGRLENVYVRQINRPMIRSSAGDHDVNNYQDEYDDKVAIISNALRGATISNCLFYNDVYNLKGEKLIAGGCVLLSQDDVKYSNVIFISTVGVPRFFNNDFSYAINNFTTPKADNIYFYSSVDNFYSFNGYKVVGDLIRKPQYDICNENAFSVWGTEHWKMEGEAFLFDKPLII